MTNVACDVIRDLLPLYAAGGASDSSKALVEEHLAVCPACKKALEELRAPETIPKQAGMEPLRAIRRRLRRRRILTALLAGAIVFALLTALYAPVIFQRGNPVPYLLAAARIGEDRPFAEVTEGVYITRRGDGEALLRHVADMENVTFREQLGSGYVFSDGERTVYVTAQIYWSRFSVWTVSENGVPFDPF